MSKGLEEDAKKQETYSKRAMTMKQEEIQIDNMILTREFKGPLQKKFFNQKFL